MLTTRPGRLGVGEGEAGGSTISGVKVVLACVAFGALAVASGGMAGGRHAVATCPASPVDGARVHAGVITAGIDPYTDVVDGRFRLHVGEYRDLANGIFQKILWWAPSDRRVGGRLVVRGRTLFGPKRTFVQRFDRAYTDDPADTKAYYPSTVVPPSAGCWKLTLTTGKLRNALVARVDG
jgi:hypothetical protein